MTNIKAIFYCKFLLFNILLFVTSVIFAQDLNFRENEFIDIGGGQKFEILRFRGEGTEKECEVFHYLNGKQLGDAGKTPPLKKHVTQKEVFAGKEKINKIL